MHVRHGSTISSYQVDSQENKKRITARFEADAFALQ